MTSRCDRFDPATALRHPLFWAGALLLALNDHVLKGAGLLPELVTGKLSDAAGFVVAPVVLAVVLRARSRRAVALCHLAPLVAMALLKLSPVIAVSVVAAAAVVGETWAIVADPTDMFVAFPAAIASWWWLARPAFGVPGTSSGARSSSLGTREIVLVGLAALACGATSRSGPQAPAIDHGRVIAGPWGEEETYVIDPNGRALRKLDVYSGDPPIALDGALWSHRYANGRQEIVAVDLRTGSRRVAPGPAGTITGIGGVDTQSVYVRVCASSGCEAVAWTAIDRATGRVRWSTPTGRDTPIVVGAGIVATTNGRRLEIRDMEGKVLETRGYDADVRALAVADALWVVDATGDIEALRPTDGTMLGRWNLGVRAKELALRAPSSHDAAASGSRFYGAVSSSVFALEIGAPRTSWESPGYGVAVSADTVIVAGGETLRGLDGRTGATRWSTKTLWGGFAAGDGIVAQRDGDSYVTILDARTGKQLSRFDLDEGEAD
jgi:outer membrane protein assembly factor BamB